MEVTKLNRIKRSKQKPWLKNYIDEISDLGAKSSTEFGKLHLKITNFSLYGTQLENIRKRKILFFVTSYNICGKEQSKLSFRGSREHDTNSCDPIFQVQKRQKRKDIW